jgi:hypothetical protein
MLCGILKRLKVGLGYTEIFACHPTSGAELGGISGLQFFPNNYSW